MIRPLLIAALVTAALAVGSACGGPVVCGDLTFHTCSDLAEAQERAANAQIAAQLDACYADKCDPGGEEEAAE